MNGLVGALLLVVSLSCFGLFMFFCPDKLQDRGTRRPLSPNEFLYAKVLGLVIAILPPLLALYVWLKEKHP